MQVQNIQKGVNTNLIQIIYRTMYDFFVLMTSILHIRKNTRTIFFKTFIFRFFSIVGISIVFQHAVVSQTMIAPAQKKGQWGYINEKGQWLIQPQYMSAKNFESEIGEVVYYDEKSESYKTKFINKANATVFELPELNYSIFSEGFLPYKEGELYGYIDSTGAKVIPAQFKFCSEFSNQKAAVVFKSGKCGYINHNRQLFISPRYDTAFDFHDKFAVVGKRDLTTRKFKYGVIDQYGNALVPNMYEWISNFHEGKAFANQGGVLENSLIKGGKWKILDLGNERTVDLPDSTLMVVVNNKKSLPWLEYNQGVCWFPGWDDGKIKMGLMDADGNWIHKPEYNVVTFIREGKAGVFITKMGFVDTSGKLVIPCSFETVGDFYHGLAKAKSGKLYGYINENGEFVINPQFDDVGDFVKIR